jgi:hypothetical protein
MIKIEHAPYLALLLPQLVRQRDPVQSVLAHCLVERQLGRLKHKYEIEKRPGSGCLRQISPELREAAWRRQKCIIRECPETGAARQSRCSKRLSPRKRETLRLGGQSVRLVGRWCTFTVRRTMTGCPLVFPGPPMPHKHNADRRHHIPKMAFKVENWPECEAGCAGVAA